ncbi:MAG: DUF917 domain-containing protein, partial [Acidimicrobiia bacterium]
LMARRANQTHGPVRVLDPTEVPDNAVCAMSAVMGAPTVLVEKLPGGEEQLRAFHLLQEHLGRKVTHVMCAEVGGLNSTLPIVAAAITGLPLVDCDAMGRAFPEIQMSTPTLYGIKAAPMALADDKGNTVIIDAIDNQWTERLARSVTIDMGATAFIALFVQSGTQIKESMIGGTLRLAEAIGDAVLTARRDKTNPIAAVLSATGGFRLFEGKITDVERRTVSGFARGRVTMDGTGPDQAATIAIQFQNENLVAIRNGYVLATVPDLITLLEADSGEPITTEELRYGYRAVVVGLPCDQRWRTPAGLELVGPRYFGYDFDYVPVEVLAQRRPN